MSQIENLIKKHCPNGVEFKKLCEISLLKAGDRITKAIMSDDFKYPVIGGGTMPTGKFNDFNRQKCITISRAGSAGFVNWQEDEFWATDVCFTAENLVDFMNLKFIYYFLKNLQTDLQSHLYGGSLPKLDKNYLWNFKIPVPPIEVQNEIVKILDNFTKLEAEL
ncbi:MAG: restriction endonuclease subunit S, partial [Campylobacter sp.]|nr:restriction endonuclease subunit S [Campylobacter sp.]